METLGLTIALAVLSVAQGRFFIVQLPSQLESQAEDSNGVGKRLNPTSLAARGFGKRLDVSSLAARG